MKLAHLQSLIEITDNELNLSRAAATMRMHPSMISRNLGTLERELGVHLVVRRGRRMAGLTEPGQSIVRLARRMLEDAKSMSRIAGDYSGRSKGTLTVATTHTQARYALPPVIRKFSHRYPGVKFMLKQGNPSDLAELVRSGKADVCLGSMRSLGNCGLVTFDCYEINLVVLTPPRHPLLRKTSLTLRALSRYPIVTFEPGFMSRSSLDKAFKNAGLAPRIALTAIDTDIIKAYASQGLGVAVVAKIAYNRRTDHGLRAIDASHLFEPYTVQVGLPAKAHLRPFAYEFIEMFAPHLRRDDILRQQDIGRS